MAHPDFNTPTGHYFLSHSVGLLPKTADAALESGFIATWRDGRADIWDHWLAAVDDFRQALAPLIGASAADIVPQTNISSALTKILFSLAPATGRTKIVLAEDDFPTIGFVVAQASRIGLEPIFLKGGSTLADPDAWTRGYADDVHLLHVTHVFSNLGLRSPVTEIVRRARERGVITVVDAAQSAGAIPVDAEGWGADFITGTSVKYLCGGPGAAWLYVSPAIAPRCAPADVGWFSHENPFEFDIGNFRYAPGAARFWGGTPSVAPYAIAKAGLAAIRKTGVAAIAARREALLDNLLSRLPPESVASHVRAGERGASFIIRPRKIDAARAALKEARILHDERAGGFRFSLHLYNDETDVVRLADALAGL
jgi:selenocysteine lyase/cysteine desulfurase